MLNCRRSADEELTNEEFLNFPYQRLIQHCGTAATIQHSTFNIQHSTLRRHAVASFHVKLLNKQTTIKYLKMNNKLLLDNLRCIQDWPKKGVNFRDVTTLFKNNECLKEICDEMYDLYKDKGITKIVGIESRGFVMSSALALRLGAGVVLCRKPGKLPCDTVQESYAKEYGKDTIEIHKDAISEDDVILLHDDLLATGGTMKAACNLVKKFHPKKVYANFIIELVNEGLNGRDGFDEDIEITSLIKI